jgi:esterase
MRAMRIDGTDGELELHEDGPADAPPILLLHGIISSSRTWDWIVPRLADRYRLLRLDFRGHGASDRTPGRYQPAGYLADAVAACGAIGRPVIVIGHSLGGITAATLAQNHPDLVTTAVLEDAPFGLTRGDEEGDSAPTALLDAFRLLRQMIPALQESGATPEALAPMIRITPSAAGPTFGEILHDDAIIPVAAGLLAVDPTVLDPVIEETVEPVFDWRVPIEVPIVAIAADPAMPDAVTQPSDLTRLAATAASLSPHTVAGSGHLIHDGHVGRAPFWEIVAEALAV